MTLPTRSKMPMPRNLHPKHAQSQSVSLPVGHTPPGCLDDRVTAPMSAPAIRCQSLVKIYGDKVAVAGIELTVEVGECFGLLGPNGACKTTTVEMLEGLTKPDSGTVELFGLPWGKGQDLELQERLGVQLQDTQLADKLMVEEVLRLFRSFYRKGRSVDDLVRELDL